MTNLKTQEIKSIYGGNPVTGIIDDGSGNGGCIEPIIVIPPITGPSIPDFDSIFGN